MSGGGTTDVGISGKDAALDRALAHLLNQTIDATGPGAVIGIFRDGTCVATGARGLASLEHRIPLTAATPLEIASVSKQVTATTVLLLAREGLVDLDADIRILLPELPFSGITLRHCLHHTSGLPDYLTISEILGVPIEAAIGYDGFLRDLPRIPDLQFPTGTDISYSNTGYVVAALGCERATGVPFPEQVRSRVFEPLGMSHSKVRTRIGEVTPGLAFSYQPDPQLGHVRVEMGENESASLRGTVGDGQVLTTMLDFAAWHGFLHDGRVLGTSIRDQLLERGQLSSGRVTEYGMGIRHTHVGGISAIGHSGSIWGYRAQTLTDVGRGVGVAVFANGADVDATDLAWRTLQSASHPEAVNGTWFSPTGVREIVVTLRGDGGVDVVGDGESMALDPTGPGVWSHRLQTGELQLSRGVLHLTDEMGRTVTYERAEPPSAVPDPALMAGGYSVPGRSHERLEIRLGASGPELIRGSSPAVVLEFLTTHGQRDVYRVEGAVLTFDRTAIPPRVTISAGSAVLRDLPREP